MSIISHLNDIFVVSIFVVLILISILSFRRHMSHLKQ